MTALWLAALLSCSWLRSTPESALPDDFRACQTDADCVVAPSLAGLDRLPSARDTCEGSCYVGVNREHLAMWEAEVARLAPGVPCDKEFEPCPPASAWAASCGSFGACQVDYAPQR